MFDARTFREVASGARGGIWAHAARAGLAAVEVPYRAAVAWRNRRYDRGRAAVHHCGVPVISVGNLTLGGTGKTPLVRWIARYLADQGRRVAILSRGYGGAAGFPNDEALELARTLPHIPHLQQRDRVAAARVAVSDEGCDVLVLDDGFQHRRLARQLDIVLLDALAPFGYGRVFPRGLLRESRVGLSRADLVVLSRADLVSAAGRAMIRRDVAPLARDAAWCEVRHAPQSWINASGVRQPVEALRGRPVAAFCGIGNPDAFRKTVGQCGLNLVAWKEFPDHHPYAEGELAALMAWSELSGAEAIVCTGKDLVKLLTDRIGELPLWAAEIEIEFLAGREALQQAIDEAARAR
jgi:tetraacyldisaccharide 4'-kinase